MAHEGGHVDFVHIELRDRRSLFHDIGHGQESVGVYLRRLAHFSHRAFAHAELDAEPADHLEQ